MKYIKTLVAGIAVGLAGVASADNLLVTSTAAGAGADVVIELLNESGASATKLSIDFSGTDVSKIDLSSCLSGLSSKKVLSVCEFAGDSLKIGIVSIDGESLGTGEIGTIRVPNAANMRLAVSGDELVTAAGRQIAVESMVSEEHLGGRLREPTEQIGDF